MWMYVENTPLIIIYISFDMLDAKSYLRME